MSAVWPLAEPPLERRRRRRHSAPSRSRSSLRPSTACAPACTRSTTLQQPTLEPTPPSPIHAPPASPWCPSLAPPLHPHRSSSSDHGLCHPPGRPAPGQAALGLCRHPRGPLVRPLPLARSVFSSPHPVSRAHPHHPWPRVICSLEPFEQAIQHRSVVLSLLDPPPLQLTLSRSLARSTDVYKKWRSTIDAHEGGLEQFSRGYEHFGLHQLKNGDIRYREWAPNATAAALTGDFSASSSLSLSLSPPGADADP